MRRWLVILALGFASPSFAQQCTIPPDLPAPEIVLPKANEINGSKISGFLLALSWSPQFCRGKENDPKQTYQCGGAPFGFILHGLWPDGSQRNDPAWCGPGKRMSSALVRQNFCMTPSPQLQQHEWAKHGTCMAETPEKYFQVASLLYRAIKYPDMAKLAAAPGNVGIFKSRFVAVNPGLRPDMISVQTAEGGWLREIRLCLAKDLRPQSCPKEDRGARPNLRLRIYQP